MLWFLPALGYAQNFSKPSPYDSAHFSWRKPVPRDRLRELQPDRPGVMESPFTVDAGYVQVEMNLVRLVNNGTENLQLDAGIHLALNRLSDQEYFVGFTLRR